MLSKTAALAAAGLLLVLVTLMIGNVNHTHPARRLTAAYTDGRPPVRIAFLFLTRGPLPLEPLWKRFFAGKQYSEQHSIWVHPGLDFAGYPAENLFHGRELPTNLRVLATWGGPGLVQGPVSYTHLTLPTKA